MLLTKSYIGKSNSYIASCYYIYPILIYVVNFLYL
nr:MAG TPA: hypothetical protein [Bacteriophage sp.]